MPNNEIEKVERLAASLARGKNIPQWIVKVGDQYRVANKPTGLSALALEVLAGWLPRIGVYFEAEFDITGKRVG